ncbi:MAG: chemotaxis protein CheA, partial [Kiritimatiellia bacterium]
MQETVTTLERIREWAGEAAGNFMLLEVRDLQGLARLTKDFQQMASVCAGAEQAADIRAYAGVLASAADSLKSIILQDASDPDVVWDQIAKVLEQGQSLGLHPVRACTPEQEPDGGSLDVVAGAEAQAPPSKSDYAPWVDDEIVAAYVEQQSAVLPEMEQQILAYESQPDASMVSSLRRTIHTLKGESGVVGAMHIEQVCHRMEDYLDAAESGDSIATDVLLAVLDWIGDAVRLFGDGGKGVNPAPILALFQQDVPIASGVEANQPAGAILPEAASGPDAVETMVPIGDRELAQDFVTESQEHFEAADEHLLVLEKDPANVESIGAVFRAFHTLKGVSGFLGLAPVGDLAHAAETLLDDIRKGKQTFTGAAVDATFDALDHLKLMIADLASALQQDTDFPVRPEMTLCIKALTLINASGDTHDVTTATDVPCDPVTTDALVEERKVPASTGTASVVSTHENRSASGDAKLNSPSGGGRATADTGGTMKVDAQRIDLLLDTIGELVIAEAIVAGDPEIQAIKSLRLEKNIALLGKITRSLQDMGMSMRLVPVDPVFRKMARLVRDLSHKSGKRVELVIEGGETEIDKSMVDKLGDPLVHMIRNSMDHGIETPEERAAAGKPAVGHVKLRAYHKGGNIRIEITDDGRGLNRAAILQKAIERKLVSSGEGMSDQDVFALIFEPGFSTAPKITEISGRGVGMDVVKRNIESLRGNVAIQSTL